MTSVRSLAAAGGVNAHTPPWITSSSGAHQGVGSRWSSASAPRGRMAMRSAEHSAASSHERNRDSAAVNALELRGIGNLIELQGDRGVSGDSVAEQARVDDLRHLEGRGRTKY